MSFDYIFQFSQLQINVWNEVDVGSGQTITLRKKRRHFQILSFEIASHYLSIYLNDKVGLKKYYLNKEDYYCCVTALFQYKTGCSAGYLMPFTDQKTAKTHDLEKFIILFIKALY